LGIEQAKLPRHFYQPRHVVLRTGRLIFGGIAFRVAGKVIEVLHPDRSVPLPTRLTATLLYLMLDPFNGLWLGVPYDLPAAACSVVDQSLPPIWTAFQAMAFKSCRFFPMPRLIMLGSPLATRLLFLLLRAVRLDEGRPFFSLLRCGQFLFHFRWRRSKGYRAQRLGQPRHRKTTRPLKKDFPPLSRDVLRNDQ
jgi:hypothetical protein